MANRRGIPSVFHESSSEDEAPVTTIPQPSRHKLTLLEKEQESVLAEDPTAFEYDAVYDEFKAESAPEEKEAKSDKPKYIHNLLESSRTRKREQEILYNKKIIREQKKDEHLYQEKEMFMTSAYKKKLEEDRKLEEEEKRKEQLEEARTAKGHGDLTGFYAGLLHQQTDSASSSKPAVQSKRRAAERRSPRQSPTRRRVDRSPSGPRRSRSRSRS